MCKSEGGLRNHLVWGHQMWPSRSKVTWVKVKGHIGQGQIRVPKKGRWAHINVKLLHLFFDPTFAEEWWPHQMHHSPSAQYSVTLNLIGMST